MALQVQVHLRSFPLRVLRAAQTHIARAGRDVAPPATECARACAPRPSEGSVCRTRQGEVFR